MAGHGYRELIVLVFMTLNLSVQLSETLPASNEDTRARVSASRHVQIMETTHFNSFDDVANFLRAWFSEIRAQAQKSPATGSDQIVTRTKREIGDKSEQSAIKINSSNSNETSFEDYEKFYVQNRTLNYLKQIYFYTKSHQDPKKKHSQNSAHASASGSIPNNEPQVPTALPQTHTTDFSRTDQVYEQLVDQVTRNMSLAEMLKALKDLREAAAHGLEDSGIASLCCPLG